MAKNEFTTEERHGIPAGAKLTPMLQQYIAAKERYPDALLFFRMGDFYEMFYADAEVGGRVLDLTVTSRDRDSPSPAPMSGFPHTQLASYLSKALAAGLKIAVCDQLEDPQLAKGLVKRGITRVVTPGVVLDEQSLDARSPNSLVGLSCGAQAFPSFHQNHAESKEDLDEVRIGVATLDVSTGSFRATEVLGLAGLRMELARLEPREILLPPGVSLGPLSQKFSCVAMSHFVRPESATSPLAQVFGPHGESAETSIAEFGFGNPEAVAEAARTICAYVTDTQQKLPENTQLLTCYRIAETLVLDESAQTNLELFRTMMDGRKKGSLLGVLDRACTAMGGRRIREWLAFPLVDPRAISKRLDGVECLCNDSLLRDELRTHLKACYDIERLNGRIAAETASPRDLWQLSLSLREIPAVQNCLSRAQSLSEWTHQLDALESLADKISAALVDDPPSNTRDGGVIRPGFNAELDEYVELATSSRDTLARLEQSERESTGISSLKIRYNKVFGYYIEISKANFHLVPDRYIRKQTLANAERYYTPELKDFEEKVLNAESRSLALENELFTNLRAEAAALTSRIGATAQALATLDALSALAELAHSNQYCRPIVDDGDVIDIEEGRHPVVEESVGRESFVPNSVHLDRDTQSLIILTGPNMAGKSTVMRQVALCVLLAQMGSFVPAKSAHIGVTDRIFTRVGAADDLAAGRSTFMVEMHETSVILKEATSRSLLILDEIGRGTSTFDGLSIAWAVAEYVHDVLGARTLFATHYHELTDLANTKPRVKNFTIAVREWKEEVIFLRQLVEGSANRSYGIQVARLAGLPKNVIQRAQDVLSSLEGSGEEVGHPKITMNEQRAKSSEQAQTSNGSWQLSLFAPPPLPAGPSAVERELKSLNVDALTPLQALNFLHALKSRLK